MLTYFDITDMKLERRARRNGAGRGRNSANQPPENGAVDRLRVTENQKACLDSGQLTAGIAHEIKNPLNRQQFLGGVGRAYRGIAGGARRRATRSKLRAEIG